MIWFTSDTHFCHQNIIEYQNRPFRNVQEMNKELIDNWNDCVTKHDMVFHLGDFAFQSKPQDIDNIARKLNGQKMWIVGNHDNFKIARKCKAFGFIGHYYKLRHTDKKFILFHYAMRVWDQMHRGSIHLYGHSHGSLPEHPTSLSMDVGVDCNNFRPISIDEVIAYMDKKKGFSGEDHHGNR